MFSFYGRKWKIIKHYPPPKYWTIIEPFAGSASYSYYYWDREIYVYDVDEIIIGLWKWLQKATKKDILGLPDIERGQKIPDCLSREEKWLIGFCSSNGSSMPKKTAGRMYFCSWNRDKNRIANDLYKIRHWNIELLDYQEIPNALATWFIDPPYQYRGKYYRKNKIDYNTLDL